jgi:hypothetical protein
VQTLILMVSEVLVDEVLWLQTADVAITGFVVSTPQLSDDSHDFRCVDFETAVHLLYITAELKVIKFQVWVLLEFA